MNNGKLVYSETGEIPSLRVTLVQDGLRNLGTIDLNPFTVRNMWETFEAEAMYLQNAHPRGNVEAIRCRFNEYTENNWEDVFLLFSASDEIGIVVVDEDACRWRAEFTAPPALWKLSALWKWNELLTKDPHDYSTPTYIYLDSAHELVVHTMEQNDTFIWRGNVVCGESIIWMQTFVMDKSLHPAHASDVK